MPAELVVETPFASSQAVQDSVSFNDRQQPASTSYGGPTEHGVGSLRSSTSSIPGGARSITGESGRPRRQTPAQIAESLWRHILEVLDAEWSTVRALNLGRAHPCSPCARSHGTQTYG